MRSVVVIGAGQAAIAFAAKLRELDADRPIVMVGEEPHLPYQRPPLSKTYMSGETTAERLLLRPAEWYAANRIDVRTATAVAGIDREHRRVLLGDGGALDYDALLLATGATPRRLPAAMSGDLDGVHVLRSLGDADSLAPCHVGGRRVVVIGGGYIGLEAAAVAAGLGLQVDVIEAAERILQRVAAPQTADIIRALHASHGVRIHEGTALRRLIGENGHVTGVELGDGTVLPADFVLVGIGVTPNTALAEAAGLEVANGVVTDEMTRTSDPLIHAAGDCASVMLRGRAVRLESVQNAIDQAEAAARVVAGDSAPYQPVPWFWSDQYDTKLQIAGLNAGYDRTVVRAGAREGALSVWYFRGDTYLAVDAINDARTYMLGKKLLELGRTISPEQAADPAVDLRALIR